MIQQPGLRSFAALIAAAGLALSACGSSSPSPTPATPSPSPGPSASASLAPSPGASLPTTGRIALPDKGYAITLPSTWTRVDLDPEAFKAAMSAGASALPAGMQDMISGQIGQMALGGVSLFAFRTPSSDLAAGTTLNVLSLPALGVPLETYESLIAGQLKRVVGQDTEITTGRVSGPRGEFLRLSYQLPAAGASIGTVQYVLLSPTKQFVISCGTPGPASAIQPECESIATTLEVLN